MTKKGIILLIVGLVAITIVGITLLMAGMGEMHYIEVRDSDGITIKNLEDSPVEISERHGAPIDTIQEGEESHWTVRKITQ